MRENARLEFDNKLVSTDTSSTAVLSSDMTGSFEGDSDIYHDL